MSLGDMFFRFDDRTELETVMSKSNEWLHIELDENKYCERILYMKKIIVLEQVVIQENIL